MNEFAAIGVGLSGMNAAREELDTTGNNIANASTPGYVRERVDLDSVGPAAPTLTMPSNGVGQGVRVIGITRLSDANVDTQDVAAQANAAGTAQTETILGQAQAAFNEPGSSGLSSQLASFWSQWDSVANNPTDSSARSALLATAGALATNFNQASTALAQVKTSAASDATADVNEVNRDATQVAQLNADIITAVAGGANPSGLADQRDALINRLAQLVGATSRPGQTNGAVDVMVGSESLVSGINSQTVNLSVNPTTSAIAMTWPDKSTVAAGGQLGALAQAANTTIPGYEAQLDASANALITAVNTQQAAGVTWSGAVSSPGQALFTGTSASTIAVSSTMTPAGIAAGSPTAGAADGSNAQAMANLGSSANGPDALYRGLIGQIGVDVSTAQSRSATAKTIQSQADAGRQSAEGVNLDEELANMTQFQNSYSASAKYLSVVDQTIQSLLAMVG